MPEASSKETIRGLDPSTYDRIVEQNGIDHDISRVEVRGLFPLTGEFSFISADWAEDAYAREMEKTYNNKEPLIMGTSTILFL
jgi:hypothetical protein